MRADYLTQHPAPSRTSTAPPRARELLRSLTGELRGAVRAPAGTPVCKCGSERPHSRSEEGRALSCPPPQQPAWSTPPVTPTRKIFAKLKIIPVLFPFA